MITLDSRQLSAFVIIKFHRLTYFILSLSAINNSITLEQYNHLTLVTHALIALSLSLFGEEMYL